MAKKVDRQDGYVNMLNQYGTHQDNSTAYQWQNSGMIPDMLLTEQYAANGLFTKIVDMPAEEAVKHGFDLGLKGSEVQTYIDDMLDMLDWEDNASTAIKWARLYGGALGVMFINDGGGLYDPLNWDNITDIDEIRVYERAVIMPDYTGLYTYAPNDQKSNSGKFGMPERYLVQSLFGQFWVHESRCLIFRNGILPERTHQPLYRFWGTPEYVKIHNTLRETIISHSNGSKLLDRSVQAIYKMKGLVELLSSEGGEAEAIKRLQVIDMARGILNSIAIDAEGEDYDFKTISFSGVKDVIDTSCNMLSAVTEIPQTKLFGRSPSGENATGESDLENYYNYIGRIQKLMLRKNLRTLIDIIIRVGLYHKKIKDKPTIKVKFNPLWSMSEAEQAELNHKNAQTAQIQAQTSQVYVDMGVLDPAEIRRSLASEEAFHVEDVLTDTEEGENIWGGEVEEESLLDLINSAFTSVPKDDIIERTDEDGDRWRTLSNGSRVLLGEGGEIKAGMGGKYTGQNIADVGNKSSTPTSESPELAAKRAEVEAFRQAYESSIGTEGPTAIKMRKQALERREKELQEMEAAENAPAANNEPANFSEVDETTLARLESESARAATSMSQAERDAAIIYTGPEYATINEAARTGNIDPNRWVEFEDPDTGEMLAEMPLGTAIQNLDTAIDRFELADDVVTFRGVSADFAPTQAVGETFSGNMFYSTSVDRSQAEWFAGNDGHLLEIRVPAGSPAMFLNDQLSVSPGEQELLISRHAQYRVVEQASGRTVLEVVR